MWSVRIPTGSLAPRVYPV